MTQTRDRKSGVVSIEVVFKAMRPDEITKGVRVVREKFKDGAQGHHVQRSGRSKSSSK